MQHLQGIHTYGEGSGSRCSTSKVSTRTEKEVSCAGLLGPRVRWGESVGGAAAASRPRHFFNENRTEPKPNWIVGFSVRPRFLMCQKPILYIGFVFRCIPNRRTAHTEHKRTPTGPPPDSQSQTPLPAHANSSDQPIRRPGPTAGK
jgi:hypothetical protein